MKKTTRNKPKVIKSSEDLDQMSTNGHIVEVKVITTTAPEGEAEVCPGAPLARSQFPRVDDPGHSCLLSP